MSAAEEPPLEASITQYERLSTYLKKRPGESLLDAAERTLADNWRGRRREVAKLISQRPDGGWETIKQALALLEGDPVTGADYRFTTEDDNP